MRVDQVKPASTQASDLSTAATVLTASIVVGSLYFASDVVIPLALAVLISFVLAPLVAALLRIGIPRVVAVIVIVAIAFGTILGIGALGTAQISQLAENLPRYQSNLRDKIRSLKVTAWGNGGTVSRATSVIEDLGDEISVATPKPVASPLATQADLQSAKPIQVEIKADDTNPFTVATKFLRAIGSPLASTFLVMLFVVFLLMQQKDLRDRVIRLLGTRELHRTTAVMEEAARGLSKYFLLQTAINAAAGTVVGLGLWFIGVPSPLLWGIFAMLLRFVPYAGPVLAAVLPVALAASVDPGWTMVISTAALFLVTELVVGQVVEPLVFGHYTGLSPVATMVAAAFWTWLWGPIGLILAIPLTMCLVILGQHTKRLEFLHVLLGDQPVLTPPESFYQRLIAGDPAEIIDQAELQLKDVDLTTYFEEVALPALALAQRDVSSGELPAERQSNLVDGVTELIDGLIDSPVVIPQPTNGGDSELTNQHEGGSGATKADAPVICLAGHGVVNQAATALFVHLLREAGVTAELGNQQGVLGLAANHRAIPLATLVCLSYVGEARTAQVRYTIRRIRRQLPDAKILVGLWRIAPGDPELTTIKENSGADLYASTLREAVGLCRQNAGMVTTAQSERVSDIPAMGRGIETFPSNQDSSLVPQGA